jgi:hypothetical protein
MDRTEMVARDYLESLKLGRLVYEPDGKQPPDFLIDGRIAVEVRRLNRHVDTPDGPRPLEKDEYAILALVRDVLQSFGPPRDGRSWFLNYEYQRPLPPYRVIKRSLIAALEDFLRSTDLPWQSRQLGDHFEISLMRAGNSYDQIFMLGGHMDLNTSGFVIPDLIKNIHICSAEKIRKIGRVKARYSEWWLVLVDRVTFGIREDLRIPHEWDKLILVSPLEDGKGYEVQRDRA